MKSTSGFYSKWLQRSPSPSLGYHDAETDSSPSTLLLEKSNGDSDNDNDTIEIEPGPRYGVKSLHPKSSPKWLWLMVHICIFLIYTTIFIVLIIKTHTHVLLNTEASSQPSSHISPLDMTYSPLREAIHYEVRTQHNSENITTIFQGPPTKDTKKAWMSLFEYGDLLISDEELEKLDRTSIQVADGSGRYVITPDTYHQLHCLWRIYEWVHAEAYDVKMNEIHLQHIEHCIDLLRSFVQCHATASVMTYEWTDSGVPVGNYEVNDVCVDWDYYQNWITQRALDDPEAPGVFLHQELGPVSRKGKALMDVV